MLVKKAHKASFLFSANTNIDVALEPIVKWPGGKAKELKYILPNLPYEFKNYYEPFIGGGAVYLAVESDKYFINDKSEELIRLYKVLQEEKSCEFYNVINEMICDWKRLEDIVKNNREKFLAFYSKYSANLVTDVSLNDFVKNLIMINEHDFSENYSNLISLNTGFFSEELHKNICRKIKRMRVIECEKRKLPDHDILNNIETAFKSGYYMYIRYIYNHKSRYNISESESSAFFLFIRNYAYSGMFRYNSKGQFNVPYGGMGYNNKNLKKKLDYLISQRLKEHLNKTVIENQDFESFLKKHSPTNHDFIFLDPPYDTEFSTYSQNSFDKNDHKRLANYLINETKAKWMLVIKNTDFIKKLYSSPNLKTDYFDKTYLVSFMNRNNKDAQHLLIRNY